MPNDFFNPSGWPSTSAQGASADARAEMALIAAGFALLPDLTTVANRVPHINAGSTAIITTSGFTFDGTTLTAPAIASTGAFTAGGAVTVTSTSASALAVGANGATNPVLKINASTASVATGISITGAAAAGGVALAAISSGTNENLSIDAKGSGTITLGGTSTGAITLTRATTMSAALTYGGVTLSNAVTGTGNMVLASSPSLTTPTINTAASVGGTWTAAATWTLPAFTLDGTVTSNGQSFSGTIADLGTVTTADINGGTLDGVTIGGASAAAATVTSLTVSSGGISVTGAAWLKDASTTIGNASGVGNSGSKLIINGWNTGGQNWQIDTAILGSPGELAFTPSTAAGGLTFTTPVFLITTGGATIASGQTLTLTGATVAGAPTWSSTQTLNTSGTAATVTTAAQTAITSVGTISTDFQPLGSSIPQNSQSAAYTTVAGDANKHILHPTADNNPRTFTIDSNANVAYKIGTCITFVNQINTVTIAITTDTMTLAGTATTGSRTLAAGGGATALKIAATEWIISGTGLS